MRNLIFSIDCSDLIDGSQLWAQTSVDTENLIIYYSTKGKIIEDVGAIFPRIGIAVFSDDFIVKSVDLCDLS